MAAVAAAVAGCGTGDRPASNDEDSEPSRRSSSAREPSTRRDPIQRARGPDRLLNFTPDGRIEAIGRWRINGAPTVGGAKHAFGQYDNDGYGTGVCRPEWTELGLSFMPVPCAADDERAGVFLVGNGWYTPEGLADGDPVEKLLDVYPDARKLGVEGDITIFLIAGRARRDDTGLHPGPMSVTADVEDRRVAAFGVFVE